MHTTTETITLFGRDYPVSQNADMFVIDTDGALWDDLTHEIATTYPGESTPIYDHDQRSVVGHVAASRERHAIAATTVLLDDLAEIQARITRDGLILVPVGDESCGDIPGQIEHALRPWGIRVACYRGLKLIASRQLGRTVDERGDATNDGIRLVVREDIR